MSIKLPRSAGGWGAIRYSLKMADRAGGLWPMLKALALFENSEIKIPDFMPILRTNTLLKPLRDQPEIKKFLENN